MTVQEAYKQLLFQLYELYDDREAANIADLVIEHITGQRKIDRVVNKQMPVSPAQQNELEEYAQQLLLHKPVQYVLHEAWFAGLKFYVDENVLIPRPETEELVSWIADFWLPVTGYQLPANGEEIKTRLSSTNFEPRNKTHSPVSGNRQQVTLLDIGTGSGCIPIALKKKFMQWDVHALDISPGALQVAQKNAILHHTDITFHLLDILDEERWDDLPKFNIIVSNPPYIRQDEAEAMHNNVIAYEPHAALFVPNDDALLFYKRIADFATLHLNENGLLFFEINESLGKEVCHLLETRSFVDIELRKDLQGKDRMVRAIKI